MRGGRRGRGAVELLPMPAPCRVPAFLLLASLAAAAPRPDLPAAPVDPHATVRGITITCPGSGRIWGTEATDAALQEIAALGANWVAIHPYASIAADGRVGGPRTDQALADPEWIRRPIAEAHRLGLKIMIKPHLAYWGSPFAWRGEIRFADPDRRARFFATYEAWIARVAEVSVGADAFVVGTELDGTIDDERAWRGVIAAIRARTDAPLTYAANWDRYEEVRFWDALDAIGIQGYFPLVGHDRLPEPGELEAAWAALVERLEAYGRIHRRSVILAELGYNRSAAAARTPWEHHSGGAAAAETQRRCYEAALPALARSRVVAGAFLWKWMPAGSGRGNFLVNDPAVRAIVAGHWTAPRED